MLLDREGARNGVISGTWDSELVFQRPGQQPKPLWRCAPKPAGSDRMYGFTEMALSLNEIVGPDVGCCPTDSRFRPDKNEMEAGHWNSANKTKVLLEEAQRARRRKMESEKRAWEPRWFTRDQDPAPTVGLSPRPGRPIYRYKGGYWEHKEAQDWAELGLVDIYATSRVT